MLSEQSRLIAEKEELRKQLDSTVSQLDTLRHEHVQLQIQINNERNESSERNLQALKQISDLELQLLNANEQLTSVDQERVSLRADIESISADLNQV
jgi:chromosome segregation ATPase